MRMNVGKQLIKVIDDKRSRFERLGDLFVFFCQYPIQSPVFVNSMVDDPLLAFLWLSIPNGWKWSPLHTWCVSLNDFNAAMRVFMSPSCEGHYHFLVTILNNLIFHSFPAAVSVCVDITRRAEISIKDRSDLQLITLTGIRTFREFGSVQNGIFGRVLSHRSPCDLYLDPHRELRISGNRLEELRLQRLREHWTELHRQGSSFLIKHCLPNISEMKIRTVSLDLAKLTEVLDELTLSLIYSRTKKRNKRMQNDDEEINCISNFTRIPKIIAAVKDSS